MYKERHVCIVGKPCTELRKWAGLYSDKPVCFLNHSILRILERQSGITGACLGILGGGGGQGRNSSRGFSFPRKGKSVGIFIPPSKKTSGGGVNPLNPVPPPRISEGQGNICPEWGTFCAEASGKGTSASIGGIKVTGEGGGGLGAGPRIRNKKCLSCVM